MEGVVEKKKNNKISTVIICVLLIIIIGLCGFIYLNKDKLVSISSDTVEKEEKVENKNTETVEEDQNSEVKQFGVLDLSKAINSSIDNYHLSAGGSNSINAQVDSTQKVLTFNFVPATVVKAYDLSWNSERTDVNSSNINFKTKIVDIFFGGMGQDASGDTLFILMEDGSVEYIPLVHMFNHAQDGPISYGKIPGVSNVIKFANADMGNGVTTLAIRQDGTFYDLYYSLKDTGNY